MKKWMLALAISALCAPVAQAEWETVAEVTAGGEAKDVALARTVRVLQIECTEGVVTVDALTVREGEAENPIGISRQFHPGETQDVDLGYDRQVTGLRIRDDGTGKYRIHAK